jgi:protein-disulfide isomerase
MKKTILSMSLLALVTMLTFVACTEEADSKPHFIFKAAPNENVAAKIKGEEVTFDKLLDGVENDLYEAEMKVYELKMNQVRAMVLKKYMESDSAYKGDNDKFLDTVIAKGAKVSEKEVNKFATERKIPKQNLDDQLKGRIKQFLLKEKKQQAIDTWLARKTKKTPVEVYLKKPQRPVKDINVGSSPFMGKADAKVTVVEFSDFQCPYCSKGAEIMDQIKKKYKGKVKIVFKNFPLPFHTHAKLAAAGALCAREQKEESFWKLHDLMFKDQSGLAKEGLVAKAKKIGLDEKKFSQCLDEKKFMKAVEDDMAEGKRVGVKSTPTFFVNGQMVNGAQPLEVFSEIIDEQMAK